MKSIKKIIVWLAYAALFIVLTIVNFFTLGVFAAIAFESLFNTVFAFLYLFCLPPVISGIELHFIQKRLQKRRHTEAAQTSSVIWDVACEHIPDPDLLPISPPAPVFSIPNECAKYGGPEAQLLNIDLMEGHDFEHWCAGLLLKIGFQNVEVTQASGDDGVDIIAQKDGIRYAIQCKRYSSDLGNKPIQEVHTGKSVYSCHVGAVMTNRYFTAGGKRAAEATGTLLWDRDWIKETISKVDLVNPIPPSPLLSPSAMNFGRLPLM